VRVCEAKAVSTTEVLLWGGLGGVIGYALAYLLPFFRALNDGVVELGDITTGKIIGLIGLATLYVLLGAGAALVFDPDTAKFAVITGAGFEGLFRAATTKIEPKK
jgi:hypothetical protein